jgi:hypothetical protein
MVGPSADVLHVCPCGMACVRAYSVCFRQPHAPSIPATARFQVVLRKVRQQQACPLHKDYGRRASMQPEAQDRDQRVGGEPHRAVLREVIGIQRCGAAVSRPLRTCCIIIDAIEGSSSITARRESKGLTKLNVEDVKLDGALYMVQGFYGYTEQRAEVAQ